MVRITNLYNWRHMNITQPLRNCIWNGLYIFLLSFGVQILFKLPCNEMKSRWNNTGVIIAATALLMANKDSTPWRAISRNELLQTMERATTWGLLTISGLVKLSFDGCYCWLVQTLMFRKIITDAGDCSETCRLPVRHLNGLNIVICWLTIYVSYSSALFRSTLLKTSELYITFPLWVEFTGDELIPLTEREESGNIRYYAIYSINDDKDWHCVTTYTY